MDRPCTTRGTVSFACPLLNGVLAPAPCLSGKIDGWSPLTNASSMTAQQIDDKASLSARMNNRRRIGLPRREIRSEAMTERKDFRLDVSVDPGANLDALSSLATRPGSGA